MTRIADVLGVSRSHLSVSSSKAPVRRGPYRKKGDDSLLERIEAIIRERPTYGYRRVTAMLNRGADASRVNHKRVYRVMRQAQLLLPKYTGRHQRPHEGKVITLASNLRWCSDCFEIRCWNGERVHVAFSLDCHDREILAWVAAPQHLDSADIRDLMAMSIDARFDDVRAPHPVEWLSDNGPPYTAHLTRDFGRAHGLLVCNTPAYSPESNGMAEAFVKTFKRDYVYLADVDDAEAVLRMLPEWFADYNENHPHKGLNMLSPRQFRRLQSA